MTLCPLCGNQNDELFRLSPNHKQEACWKCTSAYKRGVQAIETEENEKMMEALKESTN